MIELLISFIALASIGGGFLFYRFRVWLTNRLNSMQSILTLQQEPKVTVNVDTQPIFSEFKHYSAQVKQELNALPEDILRSLTGSANTHKGKLGELIGYISLKAEYDKIIPLGSIVDFMCISFPTDTNEGTVDFIDIKTGDSARLNKDQRALKNLITGKKIKFKTIKIDTIDGMPDDGSSTDTST
jgi:predicted Holliday junction resolvase-like endonuclease